MTTVGAGGVCGADWGCWVAGYTQRSSTLFAVYGANNLCRGSPQREVSRRHSRQHVLSRSLGD